MPKICLLIVFLIVITSCNTNLVYTDYKSIEKSKWHKDKAVVFDFADLDTLKKHNIYINVRNDQTYPFSNLYLITELDLPNGETIVDTLLYEMAEPNGQWLGKGLGGVKESKLWYRENIVFRDTGNYQLKIAHAMRKNGEIDGLENLEGLTDIGIQIEKTY